MGTEIQHCVVCNTRLSQYNTSDRCYSHSAEDISLEIFSAVVAQKTKTEKEWVNIEAVIPASPSSDELLSKFDCVASMVLQLMSEESKIPLETIAGHSHKEIPTQARHIAMYLLRVDFNRSFGQISDIFGKADHAASWSPCNKIANLVVRNEELRKTIENIRSGYSLNNYPDLKLLAKNQRKLFPKQKVEAEELRKILNQKFQPFTQDLCNAVISDRNQEAFEMRYGFGKYDYNVTLAKVGIHFDVTRERIRQIIDKIWLQIKQKGSSEIRNEENLLEILTQLRILNHFLLNL